MQKCKWSWRGLASAGLLATAVGTASAQLPMNPTAKPPAIVNGQVITRADLDQAILRSGPAPAQMPDNIRRQRDAQIVMQMIDEMLWRQYLLKHVPKIEPIDVERRVTEITSNLAKEGKTLGAYLAEVGQNESSLRAFLTEQIRWERFWAERLTETDVQKYYAENKDYFDGVMVRASHIVVLVKPSASDAERQKARTKLMQLRTQIMSGRIDFALAAQQYSESASGKEGGDMGYFPRKFAVEDSFAKVAFALQPGQVSEVVQTEIGFHLIRVTDRRREAKPGEPLSDYSKIKEGVRALCVDDTHQAILAELRKAAKIEINIQ